MLGFLLITAITFIERFNRAFIGDYVGGFTLALVAFFRVPSVTKDALAFRGPLRLDRRLRDRQPAAQSYGAREPACWP